MHRTLATRVASPLVAAMLVLLGSMALGADAMPAPSVGPSVAAAEQATQVGGNQLWRDRADGLTSGDLASAAAPTDAASGSVFGLAAQSLGWAGAGSPSVPDATLTPAIAPTPAATPTRPATAAPKRPATTTAAVWWSRYRGTNHVWMPTLGVSKGVTFYACGQTTYPANYVYRWGCGGQNNVYLFGHNFGVFNPLYEAWLHHTLQVGMPVVYADGSGRTHLYRVTAWRVVQPTDTAWATASQPRPSLTLQTCANLAGTTRLVVRLVAASR